MVRGCWVSGIVATAIGVVPAACTDDDATGLAMPPTILEVSAAASPRNALAAIITARVIHADSLVVRYGLTGEPMNEVTPALAPESEGTTVPVLGLLPETPYTLVVEAYGREAVVWSSPVEVTTGPLPPDLPTYVAGGSDPTPGYIVFAAGRYGLAIDNSGRVAWYHAFPNGPGLNFDPQPNGRYTARPPPSDPGASAAWVEIDPLGNVTRSLDCAGGLQPRFHDLIAMPDGGYWIMCDETRTMDLSGLGGSAAARVTGTVIQRLGASGALAFAWSPFDHFAITDLEPSSRTGATVNWTHGNALALDEDDNLVVSFRSLSEVTKIDARSGAVIWRMGGLRNQFTFLGTPVPPFARQHGVRLTGSGRLVLLDNSGDPLQSRAERYVYDAEIGAARLVASYGPQVPVIAQLGGTTQDLPGGHVLVAFGDGGRVQEYDAAGNVVWQIEGNAGYIFRAQRIASLYQPGADTMQ